MDLKRVNQIGLLFTVFAFLGANATGAHAKPAPLADLHLGVDALLEGQAEIGRLGLQAIQSPDPKTAHALEMQLLQILEERRLDVITPEKVRQQLQEAQGSGDLSQTKRLWADHLVMGQASVAGKQIIVALRLVQVSSGEALNQVTAYGGAAVRESSLAAATVRGAVERMADGLYLEMSKLPGNTRYQRVAVMPLEENGQAASELALGTYFQQELSMALKERGYLIVERSRLNEAVTQMGVAQSLDASNAPAAGKMLGAQLIVLGAVADAGEHFMITGRALDAQSGTVLGATAVKANRDNVVTLGSGAIETRSMGGAMFRSALVPGWGQYYYRKPIRAALWAVSVYGSAVAAAALFGAGYSQQENYLNLTPSADESPSVTQDRLNAAREQANNLYTSSVIVAGTTGLLWLANLADAAVTANQQE